MFFIQLFLKGNTITDFLVSLDIRTQAIYLPHKYLDKRLMYMKHDIIILNFSNVYTEETFYKNEKIKWINCNDISGANCFCDNEASAEICRRIKDVPPQGIHFIDSGNYHYVSKFFTDKINEDFILVVLDHHPDMQPSLFDELLTCGSWVKASIDTNKHLKKVILIGTSDELLNKIDKRYTDKLIEFKESQLEDRTAWQQFYDMHFDLPIYISIDKDVLSPDEDVTNWDQGKATMPELKRLLSILLKHGKIIGIDICGECKYSILGLQDSSISKDNEINRQLAEINLQDYKS